MLSKAAILLIAPVVYAQSVEGTLTSSVTHAPLPGLTVTLSGRATYTAVTDAAGAFHFSAVKPGDYTARADAHGFIGPPRLFNVGDSPVRLALELLPLCRLQGRVLLADGRPARLAPIAVLRYRGGGGSSSLADEEGRFTVDGMAAGLYLVVARAPGGAPSIAGEAWAPTYFPNAVDRGQAQHIPLKPGADVSGYEIRLRSVPVFRVRGVVRDDTGKPAAHVSIGAALAEWTEGPEQSSASGEDGAFEFPAIRAGDWEFFASVRRGDVELKGIGSVVVGRHDVDGVEIRLAPPFAIRGFVEREDRRDASGERKVSGVSFIPDGARRDLQVTAFHAQDGSILIKNVYPGRYVVQPIGFAPGYYLESVKLGEREVLGQKVDLYDGSLPLRVTYKADAPRVRGTVENGEGAAVVLVPQDEAFVSDQFIRSATAGAGGHFEIGNLRPGDYYAFAFDRAEWTALNDPAFVRGIAARAEKVHVEKGESASVDLKITPWPE